jgi:peptidoglycan/xylan/chitin deacetylase (PgdA/CDA1 family)
MSDARTRLFRAAFAALDFSGANRLLASRARGLGLILTLHHVRPFAGGEFAPNRLLEIEPAFLDLTLTRARELGFEFVTLDEAWRRVREGVSAKPFLHLTYDDGYRDVRDFALPIMRRHGAPATLYIASGFADGDAGLWWLALEQAIARAESLTVRFATGPEEIATGSPAEKQAAWDRIYWALRSGPEEAMRAEIDRLAAGQGVDLGAFSRDLCMRWDELAELAKDPLVEIGAHTVTHPMLAKHPEDVAWAEMAESRRAIREKLGIDARHFAYPVGNPDAAGPREFALAAELDFETAVTTMPGHLTAAHAASATSLPRVSLNGLFQTRAAVDALLSGAPFLLTDVARRLRKAA